MEEDETILDLTLFPQQGEVSEQRAVVFGPASDKFAFLAEIDPASGHIDVVAGNTPAVSVTPAFLSAMLRELADEIDTIAQRPDFLEWIYGTPLDDED